MHLLGVNFKWDNILCARCNEFTLFVLWFELKILFNFYVICILLENVFVSRAKNAMKIQSQFILSRFFAEIWSIWAHFLISKCWEASIRCCRIAYTVKLLAWLDKCYVKIKIQSQNKFQLPPLRISEKQRINLKSIAPKLFLNYGFLFKFSASLFYFPPC